MISVDALLSIAKDITLGNGTKHRCIDATQIHELPKTEIVRCKDCKRSSPSAQFCYEWWKPTRPNGYCHKAKEKDGEQE